MGLQATMTIGDKRGSAITSIATATATYPLNGEVRIAVILPTADNHRTLEVHNRVRKLLDYARDNNLFVGAGSQAIISSIDGSYRLEDIATNVVTGDIALMVNGAIKDRDYRNIIDNAHRQLLDAMREAGSVTVVTAPLP